MRSRLWIVVWAAVALVSGCGDDPTLSAGAADDLHAQVAAVREAAGEGDRVAALEALDSLQADVKDLEAGGSLAEADAAALRRGIGRARRRVRAEVAEPTPAPAATPESTPEPTPEPTPVPTEPEDDAGEEGGEPGTGNDDEKGPGEAQGKGKDKDKGKKGGE